MAWVLRDKVVARRNPKNGGYFVKMVAIGPMEGSLTEAARFNTREDAERSPAFFFPLTVFEAQEELPQ